MNKHREIAQLEALGLWDEADEVRQASDLRSAEIERYKLEDYAEFLKRQKLKNKKKSK